MQIYIIYICNIYSTVGRSIADIYDRSAIFTEAQSAEVNMSAEVDMVIHLGPVNFIPPVLYHKMFTEASQL